MPKKKQRKRNNQHGKTEINAGTKREKRSTATTRTPTNGTNERQQQKQQHRPRLHKRNRAVDEIPTKYKRHGREDDQNQHKRRKHNTKRT